MASISHVEKCCELNKQHVEKCCELNNSHIPPDEVKECRDNVNHKIDKRQFVQLLTYVGFPTL